MITPSVEDFRESLTKRFELIYDNMQLNIYFDRFNDYELIIAPVLPTAFNLLSEYDKIFQIVSETLYPFYTVLSTVKPDIVSTVGEIYAETGLDVVNNCRGLRFRLLKGTPEQMHVDSVDELINNRNLRINNQITLDFNDIVHTLITGQTGSGKTYTTLLLLNAYAAMARKGHINLKMTIVDPKLADLKRFADKNGDVVDKCIAPRLQMKKNAGSLMNDVNTELSKIVDMIIERQGELLKNKYADFPHYLLVIDELIALQVTSEKEIVDKFKKLLTQILVTGRETNVHVMLISQSFNSKYIDTTIREQANLIISMGEGNALRFLFDDDEYKNVVVPVEKGGGIMKIIDNKHPIQALPVIFPTVDRGL